MRQIDLNSPACLLLGLTPLGGQICQLGIALQYPPIQLLARPAAHFQVSGPQAELAYQQGWRFLQYHDLRPRAEVEIELTIPSFMGLGFEAMLGLSMAQSLAALHGLPTGDTQALAQAVGLQADQALETQAFARGGLLVVGSDGALQHRQAISHQSEEDDWVFVFALPRAPSGTPETLEIDRRAALSRAARYLSAETERIFTAALWPAAERDDIAAFAQALMEMQAQNYAALASAGQPLALTPDEQATLDVMRDNGALAWGRTLTGLGHYALIQGGGPSRALRRALDHQLGLFGGTVMATLCDNGGARL